MQPPKQPDHSLSPHRPTRKILVLLIALAVGASTVALYLLTRPIPLTIHNGSRAYVLQGDFMSASSLNYSLVYINATTTANESGYPSSTLTLQVRAGAFGLAGTSYNVDFLIAVVGHFAPNLRPSGLALTYNETGQGLVAYGSEWLTGTSPLPPVNVTTCPPPGCSAQVVGFADTGSGTLTSPLFNQNGAGAYYYFSYPALFFVQEIGGLDFHAGIRVSLTGPFEPSIDVVIDFTIIDRAP